eukprot:gene2287-2460_t
MQESDFFLSIVNSHGLTLYNKGTSNINQSISLLSVIYQTSSTHEYFLNSIYTEGHLINFETLNDKDEIILLFTLGSKENNYSFQKEYNQNILKYIIGILKLQFGKIEYNDVHDENIEVFKKKLRCINGFIDKFLMNHFIDFLIPYPRYYYSDITSNNSILKLINEKLNDLPCALYFENSIYYSTDSWISQSYKDLKLIEMFNFSLNNSTGKDTPIYLKDGTKPVRLLTMKLFKNLDLFILFVNNEKKYFVCHSQNLDCEKKISTLFNYGSKILSNEVNEFYYHIGMERFTCVRNKNNDQFEITNLNEQEVKEEDDQSIIQTEMNLKSI